MKDFFQIVTLLFVQSRGKLSMDGVVIVKKISIS